MRKTLGKGGINIIHGRGRATYVMRAAMFWRP
jgi:hypothetical protein